MRIGGLDADIQPVCDRLGGPALGDQIQVLTLPRRQGIRRGRLRPRQLVVAGDDLLLHRIVGAASQPRGRANYRRDCGEFGLNSGAGLRLGHDRDPPADEFDLLGHPDQPQTRAA